ncbi:MAG: hypothetical protein EPN14_01380 [Gallionella sp.]|nr:MAG: hypothetical protein EPN14_01380 [Gallionella sp.]
MTNPSGFHELKEMRRVAGKGALLLPFLLLLLAELFVLPIDFFTFRVWEAALAEPYRYPGPFYPNLHVRKEREYGDRYRLDSRSRVEAKPVEWFTDAYGWRNRPEIEQQDKYDVVVLGDSNIVGSFLDQGDVLAEVMGARSKKVVYSYSYGSDHISLYFSDSRMEKKSGELLVLESKAGNWSDTNGYLYNFCAQPDGSLDIRDRSTEFVNNYYAPSRNTEQEKIESRLTKQVMFHWLKASLATGFEMPARQASELFFGRAKPQSDNGEVFWRPFNWVASGGILKPLSEERQPALALRAASSSFWKTEQFVSSQPDGKILVRFEAKNSVTPSRHRLWIHEDGSYRSVGEFVAGSAWQTFEIPITPNTGSILELQIDQTDAWQWLSIRDFRVVGGAPLPVKGGGTVAVPMAAWTSQGTPCAGADADCRQWDVAGKKGYVQTPVLPQPGEAGLLIRFEARSDRPATAFTPVYLFEGEKYRAVAQYAFGHEWQEFSLLLKPDRAVPAKIQVDYPEAAGSLAIRNFQAIPVERLR